MDSQTRRRSRDAPPFKKYIKLYYSYSYCRWVYDMVLIVDPLEWAPITVRHRAIEPNQLATRRITRSNWLSYTTYIIIVHHAAETAAVIASAHSWERRFLFLNSCISSLLALLVSHRLSSSNGSMLSISIWLNLKKKKKDGKVWVEEVNRCRALFALFRSFLKQYQTYVMPIRRIRGSRMSYISVTLLTIL